MGAATTTVDTSERLAQLRALMKQDGNAVNAYVIPSEDQHSSEYLADCDARRAFISGFTGSAGVAVVTLDKAYLFTDGRYFLQAGKQLDKNWELMKVGLPDVPKWQEFLSKNLEPNSKIGIDPTLIAAADAKSITETLKPRGSELVPLSNNLVDQVWSSRPARPKNPVFSLDIKYSGKSTKDKIAQLREHLEKKKSAGFVVNMLDEVAWLFNLRGSDIPYNPVSFAYASVTPQKAILFIDKSQLSDNVIADLTKDGVEIQPYDTLFHHIGEVGKSIKEEDKETKVLLGNTASLALVQSVGWEKATIERSPVADAKALKNETEVEGFRQSHIRDGAALARYFSWLEDQLNKGVEVNESQGADKLEELRSKVDLYKGLSFTTISAAGPNAAIIHYKPESVGSAPIRKDQVYLCDSGAQYLDGTIDVTRTLHFGNPTDEEKRAFTRVLQGHIAIDTLVFPPSVSGFVLDSFARRALWADGLDYRHGTGHGVGHFLNVHEGPQGIGQRPAYNDTQLKVGMTLSNEPGYYADGKFGIRIESIVIVQKRETPNNFGDRGYFGFERVTMSPIHRKLVEPSLLSAAERKWLDDYHQEVLQKLSPLLQGADDASTLAWLQRECQPL